MKLKPKPQAEKPLRDRIEQIRAEADAFVEAKVKEIVNRRESMPPPTASVSKPYCADRCRDPTPIHIGLLPSDFVPITCFSVNREPYTAELGPEGPRDVLLIHPSQAGQMDEAGPSSAARPSHERRLDFASVIREGRWDYNRERFAPLELVQALDDEGLLPSAGCPTHILIEGVPHRAELEETGKGPRVRLYPLG
ncbi:hypothetical protein [Bradyrhizobium cenepequi]|uniref:hypothetical protein n=1 Tax=Bradyrhizobium cenepequi TaxID=2821403 RepID=UPI001CE39C90|nr:hypothetical protein [Bradyrhizobium cenepequi]MCA6108023.1 hypothetical protein [Bradyrhizobium cenepequi]